MNEVSIVKEKSSMTSLYLQITSMVLADSNMEQVKEGSYAVR